MHEEVQSLKTEVKELKESIQSMLKAWEAAGSVLKVVKWCALVSAACGTVLTTIKSGILPHH